MISGHGSYENRGWVAAMSVARALMETACSSISPAWTTVAPREYLDRSGHDRIQGSRCLDNYLGSGDSAFNLCHSSKSMVVTWDQRDHGPRFVIGCSLWQITGHDAERDRAVQLLVRYNLRQSLAAK